MGHVSSKGNSISPNSKRQTGPKPILWCLLANQRACWPGSSLTSAGSTFLKFFSSLTVNSPTSRALSSPRSPISYNPAVSAERSWLHLFCTAPDSLMTRSCLLVLFSLFFSLSSGLFQMPLAVLSYFDKDRHFNHTEQPCPQFILVWVTPAPVR